LPLDPQWIGPCYGRRAAGGACAALGMPDAIAAGTKLC
jgi:hypothetical protein